MRAASCGLGSGRSPGGLPGGPSGEVLAGPASAPPLSQSWVWLPTPDQPGVPPYAPEVPIGYCFRASWPALRTRSGASGLAVHSRTSSASSAGWFWANSASGTPAVRDPWDMRRSSSAAVAALAGVSARAEMDSASAFCESGLRCCRSDVARNPAIATRLDSSSLAASLAAARRVVVEDTLSCEAMARRSAGSAAASMGSPISPWEYDNKTDPTTALIRPDATGRNCGPRGERPA